MSARAAQSFGTAWAAAITAVAAVVRLQMLQSVLPDSTVPKTLWYDEAYAVFLAGRGPLEAFLLSGSDTTPALFNVMLSVWVHAFGDGTPALIALPFVLSVLGVWLTWLLGKEAGGAKAGLAAAAIVALVPLHVAYASEIRAYALSFCLSAASFLFLLRHGRTNARADLAAWIVFALAGLYASYAFLLVFLPQAAYFAWRSRSASRDRIRLAAVALAFVVGYLPQVLLYRRWSDFFAIDGAPSSFFSRGFRHGGFDSFLTYFATLGFGPGAFYPVSVLGSVFVMLGGAAVAVGLAWAAWQSRERRESHLLAAGAFGAVIAAIVIGFVFAPRYYVAALAPAAALAGLGIARASRPGFIGAMIVLALLPFGLGANRPPVADAFKYYGPRFAGVIAAGAEPGDLVLADHFTDMLFRRYPPGGAEVALFFPMRGKNVSDVAERFRWVDYDFMSEADYPTLEALTAGRDRLWVVDYLPQRSAIQDPQGLKRRWIESRFRLVGEEPFPSSAPSNVQRAVLLLYERK